jgi:ribosomal protein L11 methyltransferase
VNNNYIEINLHCSSENAEMLVALIGDFPFDMFEEYDGGVKAYIKQKDYTEDIAVYLGELQDTLDFSFEKNIIEAANWNQPWESNFHPLTIGNFCGIRADFHASLQPIEYELVINPKMAFGTGHHETTHLAIEMMQHLDLKGKKVLDYGGGTGILSILASKLGAKEIIAVDNEVPAYESTIENAEINHVDNITSIYGILDDVKTGDFDVILANINRNVIINSLALMYEKTIPNGIMITSGFLIADHDIIMQSIENQGFSCLEKKTKGDWMCLKLVKNIVQ